MPPGRPPRTDGSPLVWGKSAALRWFGARLAAVTVPAFETVSVASWRADPAVFLAACARRFGTAPVAVRSDAHWEDQRHASRAGEFLSVLNVTPEALAPAIDRVAAQLPAHPANGILVQRMVQAIRLAGVASTHRVADGAPWYVVELAAHDSAAVTAGRATGRQVAVARHDVRQGRQACTAAESLVLDLLIDVEQLAGHEPLEIEFALTGGEREGEPWHVHLLQVRPITTVPRWSSLAGLQPPLLPSLASLREPDPLPEVQGTGTVLSLMSDWNPAELIGTHPRPLAQSLFDVLIARGTWWQARAALGYAPAPQPQVSLLRALRGRPWVDVRRSANSLLPAGLPSSVARRIVDAWIEHLRQRPELHDKVEFEVFHTARDFASPQELRLRFGAGLTPLELTQWLAALDALTRPLLSLAPGGALAQQRGVIERLAGAFAPGAGWQAWLGQCGQGTQAFAQLARLAFVGEAQLRSAVRRGALAPERALALRAASRSAPVPVARSAAGAGLQPGHLRAGSFDVTQPTWTDRDYRGTAPTGDTLGAPFVLTCAEAQSLQQLLDEAGLAVPAESWVHFVQQAAAAREWGKFVFSRHLSGAMEGIVATMAAAGLGREEASWLGVAQVAQGESLPLRERAAFWREGVVQARARYAAEAFLIVSPLLRDEGDRWRADSQGVLPNFVGREPVRGPVVHLGQGHARTEPDLRGAIVVLRQADPGFDWLFDAGVACLITAWGGANSHMAIRCAEYGLSAAIGCGEAVFEQARNARTACVDPTAGMVWLTP